MIKHILPGSLFIMFVVIVAAVHFNRPLILWVGIPLVVFDAFAISPLVVKSYRGYLPGERAVDRHKRLELMKDRYEQDN